MESTIHSCKIPSAPYVFRSSCFLCHSRPEGWNIRALLRASKFLSQMPFPPRELEFPSVFACFEVFVSYSIPAPRVGITERSCVLRSFCFKSHSRPEGWNIRALSRASKFLFQMPFPPRGLDYPSALACFVVSVSNAIPAQRVGISERSCVLRSFCF